MTFWFGFTVNVDDTYCIQQPFIIPRSRTVLVAYRRESTDQLQPSCGAKRVNAHVAVGSPGNVMPAAANSPESRPLSAAQDAPRLE